MNEWSKYETWSFLFRHDPKIDPLSKLFLEKSSQYLSAITLPTLAAIAMLTSTPLDPIIDFLKNYCIAFRIADDLRDWRKDLNAANYTDSCVILYAMKQFGKQTISKSEVESLFLDERFIKSLYGAALHHLHITKTNVKSFNSDYLTKWIEIQIEYLDEHKDYFLKRRRKFIHLLDSLIVHDEGIGTGLSTRLLQQNKQTTRVKYLK